jgi:hypothetical protein
MYSISEVHHIAVPKRIHFLFMLIMLIILPRDIFEEVFWELTGSIILSICIVFI